MPLADQISGSLSENLITLLAHSDEFGRVVANLVSADLYPGDYRLIAERCIDYWRREGCAPGAHASDLFADILEDERDRRAPAIRRALLAMLQLSEGINGPYVVRQITTHIQTQEFSRAILAAAEAIEGPHPPDERLQRAREAIAAVQAAQRVGFDPGLTLADVDKVLAQADREAEFDLGVPDLDAREIAPGRGEILTLIAPPKAGKTWFLVSVGKRAILRRRRVAHATLEVSAVKTLQRYYQSLYGVPLRPADRVEVPTIDWDEASDRMVGIGVDYFTPEFSLRGRDARLELQTRLRYHDGLLRNLRIREWPSGALTMAELRGWLDGLEALENFIPDMLIVDYPRLMRIDPRNFRIDLGQRFVDLRGLCKERNMAGAFVHQGNRETIGARHVRAGHAGEDISIVQTCDYVMTLSATAAERRLGLARLLLDMARGEPSGQQVLITQELSTGQFCIDSAPLRPVYFDYLRDLERSDEQQAEEAEDGA